ncbi:MAG: hypothetical protein JWM68_2812, partial [Verrucomicrobiales bacterium]|nr:hypothetical protein [Verrucomicrobiales bacterium]
MKTKTSSIWPVLGILLLGCFTGQSANTFSFAGYTFNQLNTPDAGALLGNNAVLGGATFSSGLAINNT